MDEWERIEELILGADDPETEELEQTWEIPQYMRKTKAERLRYAVKAIPMLFGLMLITPIIPFWFLYEEYLLPLYWKISHWIEWQQQNACCDPIRFTDKEKREMLIEGLIMFVLLIIIIYLYYLMKK